jgi:hypothetical protein
VKPGAGLELQPDPPGPKKALGRPGEVDDQIRGGPRRRDGGVFAGSHRYQIYSVLARCILGPTFDQEGFLATSPVATVKDTMWCGSLPESVTGLGFAAVAHGGVLTVCP